MRRLLALVPAALLIFALAIPAQASTPLTRTQACLPADPSTTGATASITWDDSGTVDFSGAEVLLLHSLSVANTCTVDYVSVVIEHLSNDFGGVAGATGYVQTFLDVPPGVTKTLNVAGLTHAGLWQLPFTKWYVHVFLQKPGTTPCFVPGTANVANLYLYRADGSISTNPACPAPPASGQATKTIACPSNDGSTTGASLTLGWDNTGTVNFANRPIALLHKITITNTCTTFYVRFHTVDAVDAQTSVMKEFEVAPGTTKTIGVQGLTHLGIYQTPFTSWLIWVKPTGTTACAYGSATQFLIQADGTILPDPCP